VQNVMDLMARGIPLNEQVILYRTNAQSRLFEEACMRTALPYRLVGGVKFYARREVKDVLAYLYALHNPDDALSLLRIINVPSRKIGKTTLSHMQAYCSEYNLNLWGALKNIKDIKSLGEPVQNRISEFTKLIEKYRDRKSEVSVSELSQELLKEIQMEKWVKDDTSEGETRWENIGELLNVMHKYDKLPPEESFTSFLEEVSLVSEVDKLNEVRDDALTLMTLHLCKGLEYQHVTIAGCEEGIFPHSNAMFDKEQLEEERRLMYVGMTRAKDELHLFSARSRSQWGETKGNDTSRFIDELPPELIERKSDDIMSPSIWGSSFNKSKKPTTKLEPFRQHVDLEFNQDTDFSDEFNQDTSDDFGEGSRIAHPHFGDGTVLARRGDIVEIKFDSGEKKSFALSIAPLRVIESNLSH